MTQEEFEFKLKMKNWKLKIKGRFAPICSFGQFSQGQAKHKQKQTPDPPFMKRPGQMNLSKGGESVRRRRRERPTTPERASDDALTFGFIYVKIFMFTAG